MSTAPFNQVFYKNWDESHEEVEAFVPSWSPPKRDETFVGVVSGPAKSSYNRFVENGDLISDDTGVFTAFLWNEGKQHWEGVPDGSFIEKIGEDSYRVV